MSHFIGPNMYLIESSIQEGLYLNLDGGNKADETKVLTKSTKNDEPSSHWAIVYLGIGDSHKEEYHIINRATGTFLSTGSGTKNWDPITCTLTSPWYNIVRWSIVPVRNKTGLYWLVPVKDIKQCLAIQGGSGTGAHEGAHAVSFNITSTDKDLLWYLRLAPDAILDCVDSAPKA